MTTRSSETGIEEDELRHVLAAAGRNVLLYQDIETSLKLLLPYIRTSTQETAADPFAEMKKLFESKGTMGPLVERLKVSVESKDSHSLAAYLEQVVNNRNELVHAFRRLPFGGLTSAASFSEARAYLKGRHAFALPLLKLLREMLITLDAMLEASADPKTAQCRTLSFQVRVPDES